MNLISLTTNALCSLIFLQTTVRFEVLAACYFPDGTKADSTYQPCNASASDSACCAINKPSGTPNDICLDNGLCYAQDGKNSGLIFQSACTKQSWGTKACPSYCPVGGSSEAYYVLPCPGTGEGNWCCSPTGSDCCSGGALQISMPVLSSSTTTTSGASKSTTSASTTTATTAPTTTDSHDDAQCDDDSPSTAVSAGLGVALAVCFVGALAGLYFQRRMYRRQLQEHKERLAAQYVPTPTYSNNSPGGLWPAPVELTTTGKSAIYESGETRRESRQRF
ncbi:hypothetical protein FE257_010911 [Aspergillus nanangensis]|uniref:Uncharacterized protein n=1 Tax=Aspergillus nanangensis TaxID=2582783 RepID=A0AAD4CVQ7_ASPNN|nr:hypothetical protein FE257_010911 [Aspergillus nanangensis]